MPSFPLICLVLIVSLAENYAEPESQSLSSNNDPNANGVCTMNACEAVSALEKRSIALLTRRVLSLEQARNKIYFKYIKKTL